MPYALDPTDLPDTLLVDFVDLQLLAGVLFGPDALAGLLAPQKRRGQPEPIPGMPGIPRANNRPFDAFTFVIPVTVIPADVSGVEPSGVRARRAATWDNFTGLCTACDGTSFNGNVTLTRRRPTSGGHADHTADGTFDGTTGVTWEDLEALSVDLNFTNTSASWFDGTNWITP